MTDKKCFRTIWIILICTVFFLSACREEKKENAVDIAAALSQVTDAACFKRAQAPKQILLPDDAGPHPLFRTEWWYYTGNLKTPDGHHFGYQLTFFRQALACSDVKQGSKWRTRQIYFAHIGLTDGLEARFYSDSRINRESVGIAGAKAFPYQVWLDDWQVKENHGRLEMKAGNNIFQFQLEAEPAKPVVFQGQQGYSRKGPGIGNASYYYSIPRMDTQGTIQIRNKAFKVSGWTWFDHEWSTSALDPDTAGWDWFCAHLEDGRDLMICRVRNKDGKANGYGFGCLSRKDGSYVVLKEKDFILKEKNHWQSRRTKKTYPSHWEIHIPMYHLKLDVKPIVPDQEHTGMFAYWEGAAEFFSKKVSGQGYVELTGY